jgi:Ser/Thr protein kinase RdoA (MazF antagonist)
MQKFPVSNSTLSAKHVGFFVQSLYALSANTTCKLLKTGINHSYLITDDSTKFVFRVYSLNWRTRNEISAEIKLLNLLHQSNIPISYPITDSNSNYIQELNAPEGDRLGVLFSFAEGGKQLNFSADLHYKVGETMARIHQATVNFELERVVYTPKVLLEDPFEYINKFLPAGSDEMAWMLSAQKFLLNGFDKVNRSEIRQGAVHMDIWFDNMNITNDGNVTIFDFDFCGNGWLCYDIGYYILQLHSIEKDETERELKKKSFFAGYESVTKISTEEKRILPMLGVVMYFFYLGIQCQRYDNWSNVFFNETYLKRFINLLVKKYFEDNVSSDLYTEFPQ